MPRGRFARCRTARLLGPGRRLAGAWDFVWTTNIAHSIWAAWGPISNLIVGAMLGPASAGLFKIAATFFDSASKPADLMSRSFYPEIMRPFPPPASPGINSTMTLSESRSETPRLARR